MTREDQLVAQESRLGVRIIIQVNDVWRVEKDGHQTKEKLNQWHVYII